MTTSLARPHTYSSPSSSKPKSPVSSHPFWRARAVASSEPKSPRIPEGPRVQTRPPRRSPTAAPRSSRISTATPGTGAPTETTVRVPSRTSPVRARCARSTRSTRSGHRRGGDGGAEARDGAQPQRGTYEERLRWEQHQRPRVVDAAQQRSHQTHVVVQRQPRHSELARPGKRPHQRVKGRGLRHHVLMRQRHGLRIDGRSRGELNQGEPGGVRVHLQPGAVAMALEQLGCEAEAQPWTRVRDGGPEQEPNPRVAHHQSRAARAEHARGGAVILGHSSEAHGRIERHRDGPGEKRPEKRVRKEGAGGEDDRHAIARAHPLAMKRGGEAAGPRADDAPGENGVLFALIDESEGGVALSRGGERLVHGAESAGRIGRAPHPLLCSPRRRTTSRARSSTVTIPSASVSRSRMRKRFSNPTASTVIPSESRPRSRTSCAPGAIVPASSSSRSAIRFISSITSSGVTI